MCLTTAAVTDTVCVSSWAVRSHTCCIIDKYEDQSAINQTFQNIKQKKNTCASENRDSDIAVFVLKRDVKLQLTN